MMLNYSRPKLFIQSSQQLLVVLLSSIALTANIFAADGDLDASFGNGGKVSTDIGSDYDSVTNAAQQPA